MKTLAAVRETAWAPLDVLFVDMPPGTGDAQISISQRLPLTGAVIVSTPQEMALADARRGVNMYSKVATPILGFVENMSYFVPPGFTGVTGIGRRRGGDDGTAGGVGGAVGGGGRRYGGGGGGSDDGGGGGGGGDGVPISSATSSRVYVFGEGGVKRTAAEMGVELLGEVALDPAIGTTSDQGRPIAVSMPDSEVGRLYATMAKRLIEKTKPFEDDTGG